MKKYCIAILLPLLFLPAFIQAAIGDMVPPAETERSGAFYNSNVFHTESAFEHITAQHNIANTAPQAVQKTPALFFTAATRLPAISHTQLYASADFGERELFDNTYLSHNYPSHNFW